MLYFDTVIISFRIHFDFAAFVGDLFANVFVYGDMCVSVLETEVKYQVNTVKRLPWNDGGQQTGHFRCCALNYAQRNVVSVRRQL